MGTMDATQYCNELAERISDDEWSLLEQGDPSLVINSHNRATLLELRALCQQDGQRGVSDSIDREAAAGLERYLQDYLNEYMADKPQGHKWIVLASLYLAFVARRPLHPLDRAGVEVESLDGQTIYRCPMKVPGDNPICDACICTTK